VVGELTSANLLRRESLSNPANVKTLYSIPPTPSEAQAGIHRLVCRHCGRSVTFTDASLQERLLQAAGLQDPAWPRQALTVFMECQDCAQARPRATAIRRYRLAIALEAARPREDAASS
jgi:Fe2+ or Zn2+ uptake regulation protein